MGKVSIRAPEKPKIGPEKEAGFLVRNLDINNLVVQADQELPGFKIDLPMRYWGVRDWTGRGDTSGGSV